MTKRCLNKSVTLVWAGISLVLSHSGFADEAKITLHSLTDTVYIQSPKRLVEASLQQRSDAHKAQADRFFAGLPTVSLQHFNDTLGSDHGFQEWETMISAPIWLPGQKRHQHNLSRHYASEVPYWLQQLRWESSGLVREAVWQVMLAAAQFRQSTLRVETAENLIDSLTNLSVQTKERMLANNHFALMQSQQIAAQSELQTQMNLYRQLTLESVLPEQIEENLLAGDITAEHPLLASYGQQIATLRSEMHNAGYGATQSPTLSLGVKRERWQFGEPFNNSLGLGISVPLGTSKQTQTAVAEVNHQLTTLEIERQQLKQQLERQLLLLQSRLHSQRQQQQQLKQQYEIFQPYLTSQQTAFDNGELRLVDKLQSEQQATDLREQIQILEIQQQQTIAEINQTLGHLL